jgi:hypothetical protein
MAASSGSLGGGDDSSKLDALARSIAENSEKLEILNKLLGNIEDAGSDNKKKEELSTTDFLKNIEKIVSKADLDKARSESKKMQVDADRLASNTFRASETVLSEVLSRLGGTSFYPVLSAFRVARESVSTATGTPQSELKINDILQFVNESTSTLLTNIFTKFEFGIHTVEESVIDLNAILEQTKQDIVDIREALMPVTTDIKKELEDLSKLDPDSTEFQSISLEDIQKYAEYILALQETGQATQEHIQLLNQLDALYKETGESLRNVIDQEKQKKLVQNIEDEKERLRSEGPELQQRIDQQRSSQSELQREAMDAAATVAGIAVSLIPIGFILTDLKDITKSVGNLASTITSETIGSLTSPSGGNPVRGAANIVQSGSNVAQNASSLIGTVVGSLTPLGPALGGPIGSFAGKIIADTILAPINIAAQALVSINDAVSQIADDLVGFSPDITAAVIGREISILRDDFRRAGQVGLQIAKITEAQTRLQLASRQAFDEILVTAEPILVAILNELTYFVQTAPGMISGFMQGFAPIVPGLNNLNTNIFAMKSDLSEIARGMGTEDPLEIASLANQGGMKFFANNPAAAVRLK